MKHVKVKWREKEFEGLLVNEFDGKIEIKLKSGYNIVLPSLETEIIAEAEIQRKAEKPRVEGSGELAIVMVGGTIASCVDYQTGAVYPSISAAELIQQFPELKQLANVEVHELMSVFSEDIEQEHWERLSTYIYGLLRKEKSIVVLHGTDTMHYSSAAVSFAIRDFPKPVVFTGAQRSSDRPSSDNKQNLLNSVFTAKQEFGEVVVCMHSSINDDFNFVHRGVKVRKMHTSRRDAFRSINIPPLAKVNYRNRQFDIIYELSSPKDLSMLQPKFAKDVGILYFYPGMSDEVLSYFLEKHRGIILVGTGLGHVGVERKERLFLIKEAVDSGKIVVMTSQTINGRINMNVYRTGRLLKATGVLGNHLDMTPETAFVKLSWILGNNLSKKMYEKNIVGEISERSLYFSYQSF